MSDGRKRLSGHEYKKRAKIKIENQEQVIKNTKKLDSFFIKSKSEDNKKTEKTITTQHKQNNTEVISITEKQCMGQNSDKNTANTNNSLCEIGTDDKQPKPSTSMSKQEEEIICTEYDGDIDLISELRTSRLSKDPALWVLNDNTRSLIAKHGFDQNATSDFYQSSKRTYSDFNRFLSKELFKRVMNNGETRQRTWLIYSESKGSVFCGPCLAFGKKSNSQFDSKDGFNDWKNSEARVSGHENSPDHKNSIIDLKSRSIACNRIDSRLCEQLEEETSYWRAVLTRIVAAIKGLTSRGLALRGENNLIGSHRNGNYLMVLELIAEFDPFLAKHIATNGNPGSGHTNYLSPVVCDELINLMAERVKNVICEELKESKYFSISVDSTPDISHTDQLTLTLRYVLSDGSPCERFLAFISSVGHKAEKMFEAVTKKLDDLNIDINDCRGQSYDNASNMAGIYSGLQAKIKEKAPLAMFIPCAAHSLNLVGTAAAESCPEACHFFMLLQELYVFFTRSTNRWKQLMNEINHGKTLKRVSDTRWSARDDACQSLKESLNEIKTALLGIENDSTEKSQTKCEAKGIRIKLEKLETAIMVCFWSTMLSRLNKVSKKIQSQSVDVLEVTELYSSLIKFVELERNNFDHYEKLALKISKETRYENDCKRERRRNTKHDDCESVEEVTFNGRDHFRINTFLHIIDQFSAEFTKRLKAYKEYQEKFSFLPAIFKSKGKIEKSFIISKAENLLKHYSNDLEKDFADECCHFNAHIAGLIDRTDTEDSSLTSILQFIRRRSLQDVYPNIDISLRIALSIPATNCSGERSFSCLKRVKNYMRSTMKDDKLNSLAVLCIESQIAAKLDCSTIIDDFAQKKARKKVF